jgi:hypothetical protein
MRGIAGEAEAGAGEGREEPMSEDPGPSASSGQAMGRPVFRPVWEEVDTGLCSFERGERFYLVAPSFGSFPEIALSLKVKPEVGVGVERLG